MESEGNMARPVGLAILAAALFGAATPASKLLLAGLSPFQLAGLLYLGAAIAVAPAARRGGGIRLPAASDRRNRLRLLGAVAAGGIFGPVLLLFGLRLAASASVALWLNFEVAATALLGVVFFRDHLGRWGWAGVISAFAGALLLSVPSGASGLMAGGLVLLACAFWGLDNHLTALIDGITPSQCTFWKGLVAGTINLAIGFTLAPLPPGWLPVLAGLFIGGWAYGASIVLYISAAHELGATRAQVAFATAPFFGVALSILVLGEPLTIAQVGSAALFILGVGLLTQDRHAHMHKHEPLMHQHAHRHDDGHHTHQHAGLSPSIRHSHPHEHESMAHAHPHWPDLHHRHRHDPEA